MFTANKKFKHRSSAKSRASTGRPTLRFGRRLTWRYAKEIMKNLVLIIFLFSMTIGISYASNEVGFLKGLSSDLGLPKLNKKSIKNEEIKSNTAFIYTVLVNTRELRIHQMNGAVNNRVYVHDDGREAVFVSDVDENGNDIDGTSKLVKGCLNRGAFNYYHYSDQPLGHFSGDIFPWLVLGNCKNDPSSLNQRIEAYMLDFRDGFRRAINSNEGYYLPKRFKFKKTGQSEAVGLFFKSLESQGFKLESFVPSHLHDLERQDEFFKALEKGMKELLKNA